MTFAGQKSQTMTNLNDSIAFYFYLKIKGDLWHSKRAAKMKNKLKINYIHEKLIRPYFGIVAPT